MGWVRYLLAIAVGLAVGMAVGWYSGRVDATQQQAAGHHHRHHRRSQPVNVHSQGRRPDRTRPAPRPQVPAAPPTMRELQQQMIQCLLDHPMPSGQAACLRTVLRRELNAAPNLWGDPGEGPSLPFVLPGQD